MAPDDNPTGLMTAVALCATGAEKVLSNELKKLGLRLADTGFGKARFYADIGGLYHALMGLRTADRVLLEPGFFPAANFDALFEGAGDIPWEHFIPRGMGLAVAKVRSNRSQLRAETSIQAVVHKAIAQRLCGKYKISRLPESDRVAEVRVYIEKDMVSLLLDLSGEPLFKRGYRTEGGIAPLRETTAAAILLLSGWKRKFPLYDPFCGSGTILIEAAMYAWDLAPGLGRRFAIENFLIADKKIETEIRAELRSRINRDRLIRIAGSDENSRAVSIARSNMERARDLAEGRAPLGGIRPAASTENAADSPLLLNVQSMEKAKSPFAGDKSAQDAGTAAPAGFIVTNPPYGRRLGQSADAQCIYASMRNLGRQFPGWKLATITDHPGFESFFGSKADSCREISNGAVPSFFYQYEKITDQGESCPL